MKIINVFKTHVDIGFTDLPQNVLKKYATNLLVDAVETEIVNREEREISSNIIGELIMNKLKDLDPVAYVRFASVYREFKDVNTFMDELKKILK